MAYQSGDTILDDHYNIFVQGGASSVDNNTANVNTVWGAGTGDKGYGQSTTLATVSAGSTITATQWTNLLNRISSAASHQGTSITSISNPTTGDTISAYTALSTNITAIYNGRLDAAASGSDSTATASTTSTWSISAVTEFTLDFDSAAEARYFWNAGGMLRIDPTLASTSGDDKSTEWVDLLSQVGVIVITGGTGTATIAGTPYTGTTKIGGSGTANTHTTTTGWYDLGSSYSIVYRQYADTVPYTSNYVTIEAKVDNADITLATQLGIRVTLTDAAADETAPDGSGTGDDLDVVDGTLTCAFTVRPPSTSYIADTWGTLTKNTPTWTLSS